MPDVSQPTESAAAPFFPRDRRRSMRYGIKTRGDCQPVSANDTGNRWPIQVVDISATGVGLLLSRRFEPGTLLTVELQRSAEGSAYMPLARVCRVSPVQTHWLLGCVWGQAVAADELQALVGGKAMWQSVRKRHRQALAASRKALKSRKNAQRR